jgi:hypothetical protein
MDAQRRRALLLLDAAYERAAALDARLKAERAGTIPHSGTDGACVCSRAQAPQRDTEAVAPPIPARGTAIPHSAGRRAPVPAAGGPRPTRAARAASPVTLAKEEPP